jgi:4-hydroxy-tetrahydrodipicolinate synthase
VLTQAHAMAHYSSMDKLLTQNSIYAILITPLTQDGDIDEVGLRHLVDHCCEQQFAGIVMLGSNGEFPYLSSAEKRLVMQTAAEQAGKRTTVIAGVSAMRTDLSLELISEAKEVGCDAVLAALPAYFDLSMDNVLSHFRCLVAEGGLPVLFYHFPDTTGLTLTPEQIAMIAEIDGVIGSKLTVFSIPFMSKVIELTKDKDFDLYTGSTFLLKDCIDAGGAGVFCPLPVIRPDEPKEILKALAANDISQAEALQDKVRGALSILSGMDLEPSDATLILKDILKQPAPEQPGSIRESHSMVKEALRLLGHPITNMVKRPYTPVTAEQSKLIQRTLTKLGWI